MTEEESKTQKVSRAAGFRDFYPEDYSKVLYVLNTMRRIAHEYGYVEYETPALELLKLYELKSGEGLINETFKVQSRSEEKLVLIPELTPSLSRILSEKQQNYTKPIRWFSIPKCYRDETIQRGRVKEFWQLNVDMLGMEEIYADAEIITILEKIITACGLQKKQFMILVNDRQFMQQFLTEVGIRDYLAVIRTFDKKDKLLQERIQRELKGVFPDEQVTDIALKLRNLKSVDEKIFEKIPRTKETEQIIVNFEQIKRSAFTDALKVLNISNQQVTTLYALSELRASPKEFIQKVRDLYPGSDATSALKNLVVLSDLLENFGIADFVFYDGSLARGLDYYTGIIFEAWSREGILPRAIAGGGRYGDLVATIGGQPLTGTGFGFGETVIMELMNEFNVKYPDEKNCDVYIAPIQLTNLSPAINISNMLREKGFRTILNPFDWKIKRHFENAEKQQVTWMVIIGKKDLEVNSVTLRNIITGEQSVILIKELAKTLLKKVGK